MTDTRLNVPAFHYLMNPTLSALRALGGSGSIQEIVGEVISDMGLPAEIVDAPHEGSSMTKLEYRAAWARTYLKYAGLIESSDRGVWALTPEGQKTAKIDARRLVREIRRKQRERRKEAGRETQGVEDSADLAWQDELLSILHEIDPAAFERLCQRLLRESGFIEVEVTGRSGDGGIDGHGVIRIAGLISFTVLFQSKRYRGNIGPDTVRDFRGAMIGRADKGLIITTGGFTREARKEATRDGAPPIDLIDGALLVEKLKELSLGVETRLVEAVTIKRDWFEAI